MIENSSSVHTIPWQTSPPVIVQREEQHFFRNHGRVLFHIFILFSKFFYEKMKFQLELLGTNTFCYWVG